MNTNNPTLVPLSQNSQARSRLLPFTAGRAGKLAARLIMVGIAALSLSARAQTNKLVGEWFNGSDKSTNMVDVSGYSPAGTHDGYAVGGVNYAFTNDVPPGQSGLSLWFTAADTGIAISNSSTLDASYTNTFDDVIKNAFTVSCWGKGFPAAWGSFVSKWGEGPPYNSPNGGWQLRADGNGLDACFTVRDLDAGVLIFGNSGDALDDMATTNYPSGTVNWHFYAGTFSAATGIRSLYIDGLLAAQESNNVAYDLAAAEHLCIGAKDSAPGNTFGNFFPANGEIYDVRIYNYALTQSNILQLLGTQAPVINSLPRSASAITGSTAQFSAIFVTGTAPLYFQWQFNGADLTNSTNISGVNSGILTISNAATNNVGSYQLLVTNAYGQASSTNVTLTLQSPGAAPKTGSYGALALTYKPAGFWQLDETNDPSTGTLLAYDYSGNGLSGAYGSLALNAYGGVQSPQPPAFPGFATNQGALQLQKSLISIVTLPDLNLSTNVVDTTITMWINPNAQPATYTGLFFNRTADAAGLNFSGTQSGGLTSLGYTWNNSAGSYNWNSGLFPPLSAWSFVALVVQSNLATIYMDYIDPVTTAVVISAPATNANVQTPETFNGPTDIGDDPGSLARLFNGLISDAAVYHSALTAAQISELFAGGLGVSAPQIPASGEPVSVYAFVGETEQISVSHVLGVSVAYQWQLNGTNLVNGTNFSGVTSNTLTILNATTNDVGTYRVVLTNTFGVTLSSNVTLKIQSPSLVGEWLNGSTNFADVSGYSPAGLHDGYTVGSANYLFTNDVPLNQPTNGQSLFFNASSTGIAISNSSTLDANYADVFDNAIDGAFTVMFWAKGFPGGWNPWVSKWGEGEGGWQVRQYSSSGNAAFTVRDNNAGGADLGTSGDDMSTQIFPSNNGYWHLYAGVFNSVTGQRSLYIDGVLAADETNNVPYVLAAAEHLCIGAKDSPPGNSFGSYSTFQIYDVRLYNYAIPLTNIMQVLGNIPPMINGQPPATLTAYVGLTAQISAIAVNGTAPLYYQWQFNGTNLVNGTNFSGVNTSTLSFLRVSTNSAGSYALLVTNAYGQTLSSNTVVTIAFPHLIGNWLSGATNFNDLSGYAPTNTHDGYLVGNTNYVFTNDVPSGRTGQSLYLMASSTGLAISNSSNLDPGYVNDYDDPINGAFTVMCWARGFPGGWNPWVSKYGESGVGWQLREDGSTGETYACFTVRGAGGTVDLGANVYGNTEDMATRSIASNDGKWHHYAGVFDAGTGNRTLYIDGVKAAHATGQVLYSLPSAEHLCIGARDSSGTSFGSYSTFEIYDVRIYNYPLSSNQVISIGDIPPPLATTNVQVVINPAGTNVVGFHGSELVLTWPYGSLHQATNIMGPWTALTNTSPYTNFMTNRQTYFKLSEP